MLKAATFLAKLPMCMCADGFTGNVVLKNGRIILRDIA